MSEFGTKVKGTMLGVVTAILVTLAFEAIPGGLFADLTGKRLGGYFYVWPSILSLPKVIVATFAGAFVAKVNFVGTAVFLSIFGWLFAIHIVNEIAHAADKHNLIEVASTNILGLLIGTGGSIFGAMLGRWYYLSRAENVSDAA